MGASITKTVEGVPEVGNTFSNTFSNHLCHWEGISLGVGKAQPIWKARLQEERVGNLYWVATEWRPLKCTVVDEGMQNKKKMGFAREPDKNQAAVLDFP